jgi:hypothetical protein
MKNILKKIREILAYINKELKETGVNAGYALRN